MLSQIHCHKPGPISKTINLGIPLEQALCRQGAWVMAAIALLCLSVLQGCEILSGTANPAWLWRHSLNLINACLLGDSLQKVLKIIHSLAYL